MLDCLMLTKPVILLRIEGGLILAASLICYREVHAGWILFAALILVPDISMVGYLAGVKTGAVMYNLVHTLTGPLILMGYSLFTTHLGFLPFGLIWTAHIGMDRLLGFGLKYPTTFKDTHLQHV
jgi:hypothetical protein